MNKEQRSRLVIIILFGRAGIPVSGGQQQFYDDMKRRYPREHAELVKQVRDDADSVQSRRKSQWGVRL